MSTSATSTSTTSSGLPDYTAELSPEEQALMYHMVQSTPQKPTQAQLEEEAAAAREEHLRRQQQKLAQSGSVSPLGVALVLVGSVLTAFGVYKAVSWLLGGSGSSASESRNAGRPFGVTPEQLKEYLEEYTPDSV
jgi:hypothetical protein